MNSSLPKFINNHKLADIAGKLGQKQTALTKYLNALINRDFERLCERLGLYGKEPVAIDRSKFKAVNSKKRNFTETKIAAYIEELEENDGKESACGGHWKPLRRLLWRMRGTRVRGI